MAENTFKSPGFFEQEIELTAEKQEPTGVPAGIIGAAQMGPAFVPLTLGTFTDFENRFGTLTPEKFGPYAVREWLKNRQSVTFCRVLGAGANSTNVHFTNTRNFGLVQNAGFKITAAAADVTVTSDSPNSAGRPGAVQFLSARHIVSANSDVGFPLFTDNDTLKSSGQSDSYDNDAGTPVGTADANLREAGATQVDDVLVLCRAMILNTSGSFFQLKNKDGKWHQNDGFIAAVDGSNEIQLKLVLNQQSNPDLSWGNSETTTINAVNVPNRVYTCSLDPDNTKYIGKVLNTNPKKFQEEGHLLYLDFAIEHELAPCLDSTKNGAMPWGKAQTVNSNEDKNYANLSTGDTTTDGRTLGLNADFPDAATTSWMNLYGRFDARYRAPRTTSFISQPFGLVEYDLFHFECLSDGAVANNAFKISISNVKKSTDPNYDYGTFDVLVRKFDDSDFQPQIIERFVGCTLDPNSDTFVAKQIGDKRVVFDFDADLEEERRLVISGRYPNRSLNVRIVMNDAIYKGQVPQAALPFGFKGIPVLNINGKLSTAEGDKSNFPPLPHVYKATKGKVKLSTEDGYVFSGQSGNNERADTRIYWGVKNTRIEDDKVTANAILQSNLSGKISKVVRAYTKFMGLPSGDLSIGQMVSDPSAFNDNKFTLAQVALGKSVESGTGDAWDSYKITSIDNVGASTTEMKDAAYIRNGSPDPSTYTIADPYQTGFNRITFASLIHNEKANNFNKFSKFTKFTNIFYGGFDGLNFLDGDIEDLNDKAADSVEGSGKAAASISNGLGLAGTNDGTMMGTGKDNNVIASYRSAIKQMTDPMTVRTNLLAIPGIRDPYVTDFAASKVRDYAMAMYVMDIPNYDGNGAGDRIHDIVGRPDVDNTANNLESRAIDNNYVASYFPDVYITDPINNRRVLAPASVAALGALSYSDNVSYPWFAPAGFNRGALGFVENVRTRLSVADRDTLYERRINPIANFPDGGFVIFGQKTMQINQSALDRVNVRRLMLEVKRQVVEVANVVLFEQNTAETRARFVNLVQPRLALIQAQAGIEKFRIICDDTNNTPADAEENRLNGKIVLIPTRTIEFIALDFIVTNAGVSFE